MTKEGLYLEIAHSSFISNLWFHCGSLREEKIPKRRSSTRNIQINIQWLHSTDPELQQNYFVLRTEGSTKAAGQTGSGAAPSGVVVGEELPDRGLS